MPLPSRTARPRVRSSACRARRRLLAPTPWSRWHVAVTETAGAPPCLHATTRNWRNAAAPLEHLNAYADLLRWGERQGLLDADEAARLAALAGQRPRVARAELAATVALREAVYRVFSDRVHGRRAGRGRSGAFGAGFNDAGALLALEDGKLAPRPRRADGGLEALRVHASLSAVALFTSPQGAKVKECADDRGCGWLFVDTTRNGLRRFCFSNECGNRARQVAFRRHRPSEDAAHDTAHAGAR